jgi:hypothetical protein
MNAHSAWRIFLVSRANSSARGSLAARAATDTSTGGAPATRLLATPSCASTTARTRPTAARAAFTCQWSSPRSTRQISPRDAPLDLSRAATPATGHACLDREVGIRKQGESFPGVQAAALSRSARPRQACSRHNIEGSALPDRTESAAPSVMLEIGSPAREFMSMPAHPEPDISRIHPVSLTRLSGRRITA